jgi:hypothetical protein
VISVDGNLGFGPSNVFNIELEGTAIGEYDRLQVTGNVSLDGFLDVAVNPLFMLDFNQLFEIIDVGGMLTGQFNGLDEGDVASGANGFDLFITYAAGDGNNVAVFTAVPESTWIAALAAALVGGMILRPRMGRLSSARATSSGPSKPRRAPPPPARQIMRSGGARPSSRATPAPRSTTTMSTMARRGSPPGQRPSSSET